MTRVFNREMLRLAREVKEMTQEELAVASGVSQALISKSEHGLLEPSEDALSKIAPHVGLPIDFFYQPGQRIGLPHFHVRKRQKVPSKTLARIEAVINIRRQHVCKLVQSHDTAVAKPIPQIDLDEKGLSPESVAARMREYWLIPRGPLPSVTEIVENAGGIVILARFGTNILDGISFRSEGAPPLFFMNRDVPGERFRFSLARELGHIVMHSVPDNDEKMETEAYRFASAFLMPAQDIGPYLADAKMTNLARVKAFWSVPIYALIERSYDLKLMTEYQYKTIKSQYKKICNEAEPNPIPIENPTRIKDIVRLHTEQLGYSVDDLARMLCVRADYVRQAYLEERPRLRLIRNGDA